MHSAVLFASLFVFLGAVAAQAPAQTAPAQCIIDCGNTIDVGATCGVGADDDAGVVNCMCTNADAQTQFKACAATRCPNVSNIAFALLQHSCDSLNAGAASPAAQCTATCAKASAQTIKDACPSAASGDPTALQQCLCTSPRVQAELSQCFATNCSAEEPVGGFALAAIDCGNVLATSGNSGDSGVNAAASPSPSTEPSSPSTSSEPSSPFTSSDAPPSSSTSSAPSSSGSGAAATGDFPAPTSDQQPGKNSAASFAPSSALVLFASVTFALM